MAKKAQKTIIACVLDRSGSMASIIDDAIGGFNTFLTEQQKQPDKAYMTIALFDDQYDLVQEGTEISKVEPFTVQTYVPRGSTALYDAIGKTINAIHAKVEKGDKVLCVILTDGMENASREYTSESIKSLIGKRKDEDGWEFIYLAANQDAFAVGNGLGINLTANFAATAKGTQMSYAAVSAATTSYRSTGAVSANWDESLRPKA